jgi:hypothetical protein
METNYTIQISNPHEIARLLSLIEDGEQILTKQDRSQRGIDGYTASDLKKWREVLSGSTNERCKFANGNIFKQSQL